MKKRSIIFIIALLLVLITGCSKKIDYNSKLNFTEEKNKLELFLQDSEYTKQEDSYYLGEGFECDKDSEYAKKIVGKGSNGEEITYYYCLNKASERVQKYYSITPDSFSFKFYSNLDIDKLTSEDNSGYVRYNEDCTFNLDYSVIDNKIEGTYQCKRSTSDLSSYDIKYNYNSSKYSCMLSEKDNNYEEEECADYENEDLKKVVDEFKKNMDDVIEKSNIDLNKVKPYLEQNNK